ncbi:acyl carrier protein [Nocardiopsis halotolerans]|uniref:acyl carrier protein n=1 Tax=Nocardiopsis halotolerans TaxID=124252 RepID=UPI00034B676B|nr:acyl carrier protein [Nocardiopsis halotolerans]
MTTRTDRSSTTWKRIADMIIEMAPIPVAEWDAGTHLIDDLGYDSVTAVGLVFEVEREFGAEPAPDDLAFNAETLGDFTDALAEYVSGG